VSSRHGGVSPPGLEQCEQKKPLRKAVMNEDADPPPNLVQVGSTDLESEDDMKVRITLGVLLPLVALTIGLTAASAHGLTLGVEPALVIDTVAPGSSIDVAKTIHTPEIPPKLDLFLLIDLSGSYAGDIVNIRAADDGIFDSVRASAPDSRFGVGSFVDYPFSPWGFADTGDYGYQRDQDLTTAKATWTGAIDGLVVRFGGDGPESQYEGLYQAATGAGRDVLPAGASLGDIAVGLDPSWRAEAAKVIAITTDAPFHTPGDSSCTSPSPCPFAYPGPSRDDTVTALTGLGIKVIAIKAPGSGGEMDDIAGATGGSVQTTNSSSEEIADAILIGLGNLPVTVSQSVACDAGLSVGFDELSKVVVSGEDALFTETIMVAPDAPQGATLHCTVDWLLDGVLPDERFVEQITIHVPGISLDPAADTNEAGTSHTVTATLTAGGAPLAGMLTIFEVTAGPNAGESSDPGECTADPNCATDAAGQVSWTYTGAFVVGSDTIEACFTFEGVELCETATKDWVDTTPPIPACTPTTNPSGNNVPPAGNNPKSGQNPDGFYELTATDNVDPNPQIFVADSGSSFVAGGYSSGTKIKLVQAPGATPNVKPGAGVIDWKITLNGDALVYAVDASPNHNQSDPVACLVPPPPK
jgi:hypothetical protein